MVVYITGKSFISFALPAVAGLSATTTTPALANTYAAACAGKSKFTATVNNWKGTAAATKIAATGNCVIVNAAG